jgi:hypothetical protein
VLTFFDGRDAHDPGEGLQGNPHPRRELRRAKLLRIESPDTQGGLGEFIGQETEAGKDRGPPPVRDPDVEDINAQRVTRLGALNPDGAAERRDKAHVKPVEVVGSRFWTKLTPGGIEHLESHLCPRFNDQRRLKRPVPRVVVTRNVSKAGSAQGRTPTAR